MSIANLPVFYNMTYTLNGGALTSEALLYNDQLWQSLNQIADQMNNGLQLPIKTTTQITVFLNNTDISNGTMWFNSTATQVWVKTGTGTHIVL